MASFWRENQLVWNKEKNSSKESTWFGEPKCKLGFQVANFFVFFFFHRFLLSLLLNFCENKRCIYESRALLRAHQLPHFFINFRINIANFMDPRKMVDRENAFSAFPKCTKWKWKQKIKKIMKEQKEKRKKTRC